MNHNYSSQVLGGPHATTSPTASPLQHHLFLHLLFPEASSPRQLLSKHHLLPLMLRAPPTLISCYFQSITFCSSCCFCFSCRCFVLLLLPAKLGFCCFVSNKHLLLQLFVLLSCQCFIFLSFLFLVFAPLHIWSSFMSSDRVSLFLLLFLSALLFASDSPNGIISKTLSSVCFSSMNSLFLLHSKC